MLTQQMRKLSLPLLMQVRQWGRKGLDFLLPPSCAACGVRVQEANHLCGTCWSQMHWIAKPYCEISGIPFSYDLGEEMVSSQGAADPSTYDKARAVALFDETAQALVHKLKYYDRTDLAGAMGRWMIRAGQDLIDDPHSLVVPVPLHRRRLFVRRYNQAALLARIMARELEMEFCPDLLKRVRSTRQQVGLSEAARKANVRGAFRLNLSSCGDLSGKTVILVDDVMTTGATLEACSRVLKRAGAKHIYVIVFARVVEPGQMTI
ncbi:MAG: ComF family protein [Cohaesibacter sp.]|jgi:ComF family protein|nr:ComF family protein [Cohaesibacter sp.]